MSNPQGISPNGRPYSIIIGEASKFQAKQLQQILESEGYKVLSMAANGKEVMEAYSANKQVDLIIMELNMPVMDGYATFWDLKEASAILPKIFFVTDENTPAVSKNLIENGAVDYMIKPIKREKILERVKEAIDKVNPTFR
ncbi:MAG: response regulator [Leptospiraceae bacterium]|nr:response regulator [Leptospiraceae bacterium]MCP5503139.1 response regulator [Leptospiraceae bacterium]